MRSPVGLKEKDKILQNAFKTCQNSLDLRGQHLVDIPRSILQKPFTQNLTSLDLSYNGLTTLPEEISALVYLEEFHINHNDLNALPQSLEKLLWLKRLGLAHNRLTEIAYLFTKLTRLVWLNVSGNFVEVVPPYLLCLPHLEYFYFLHNPIENIPKEIRTKGLSTLRKYFGINIEDILVTEEESKESFCRLENDVQLTAVKNRNVCCQLFRSDAQKAIEVIVEESEDELVEESNGEQNLELPTIDSNKNTEANLRTSPVCLGSEKEKQKILTHLLKSQFEQRQLVRDLEEKTMLNLELRKLNIEYMQRRRLQKQSSLPSRGRRMSEPLSLDSGNHFLPRRRRHTTTSEYGTCSESQIQSASIGGYVLERRATIDNPVLPSDDSTVACSSNGDNTSSCLSVISDDDDDESGNDALYDSFGIEELPDRRRHITHGDICVIIPEENLSGHFQWEFNLEIMEDLSQSPPVSGRQAVASEILMMEPHGARFYTSDPAIISLPYDIKAGIRDKVLCFCSDTGLGEKPKWSEMRSEEYTVFDSHVEIRASHFSLFAIIVQKGYPGARKTIRKGVGGCLYVEEVPGVEINFPESSLLHDIEASVRVLYADKPYDVDHGDVTAVALATPVVELGPHGCQFNPDSEEQVTVRLPIPDGKEIFDKFGDRRLTFWSSSTTEGEQLNWQQFNPKYVCVDKDDPKLYSVYFSVEHFTFFRVLWDIVDTVLWEAKLGASHFLPVFQFYISCQAFMSDISEDGLRFGVCVICYRFGKPIEGIGNFPITVGCHPPKMVRKGKLIIRLDSRLFKADNELEEKSLIKEEDFTGRPCVVQFACCFTGSVPGHGTFGKVSVSQPVDNSTESQCMFSFNLDKPRDMEQFQSSSLDWEVKLSEELAGLLSIQAERDMGDEVWQDLAESIGYTPAEIARFGSSDSPLQELIAHYKKRGGQAERFIAALYRIGQPNLHSRPGNSYHGNIENEERAESSSSGNHQMCPCVKKNMRKRKLTEEVVDEKLSDLAGKLLDKWKRFARILNISENKIREIEADYRQEGVREQAFQMLFAFRDQCPDKCTLQVLSSALSKIGLGYVARQYSFAVEMGV